MLLPAELIITGLLLAAAGFIIYRIKKSPGSPGENLTVLRLSKTATKFALNKAYPHGQVESLPATLTSQEKEVAVLRLAGCRRNEIAYPPTVSANSLKSHSPKINPHTGCTYQSSLLSHYIIHTAISLQ